VSYEIIQRVLNFVRFFTSFRVKLSLAPYDHIRPETKCTVH